MPMSCARLGEAAREGHVFGRGLGVARGMVVEEDEGGGPRGHRLLEDLARMHQAGGEAAHRDHGLAPQAAAHVEGEQAEGLDGPRARSAGAGSGRVGGGAEAGAAAGGSLASRAPAPARPGRAPPWRGPGRGGPASSASRATREIAQPGCGQVVGQVQGRGPARPGAHDQRQQLAVREGRGARARAARAGAPRAAGPARDDRTQAPNLADRPGTHPDGLRILVSNSLVSTPRPKPTLGRATAVPSSGHRPSSGIMPRSWAPPGPIGIAPSPAWSALRRAARHRGRCSAVAAGRSLLPMSACRGFSCSPKQCCSARGLALLVLRRRPWRATLASPARSRARRAPLCRPRRHPLAGQPGPPGAAVRGVAAPAGLHRGLPAAPRDAAPEGPPGRPVRRSWPSPWSPPCAKRRWCAASLLPSLRPACPRSCAVLLSLLLFALHARRLPHPLHLRGGPRPRRPRLRTGSLLPSLLAHASLNALTFAAAPFLDDPSSPLPDPRPLLGLRPAARGGLLCRPPAAQACPTSFDDLRLGFLDSDDEAQLSVLALGAPFLALLARTGSGPGRAPGLPLSARGPRAGRGRGTPTARARSSCASATAPAERDAARLLRVVGAREARPARFVEPPPGDPGPGHRRPSGGEPPRGHARGGLRRAQRHACASTRASTFTPNDRFFRAQWNMRLIGAPSAPGRSRRGSPRWRWPCWTPASPSRTSSAFRKAPTGAARVFLPGFDVVERRQPRRTTTSSTAPTWPRRWPRPRTTREGVAGLAFGCALMPVKVLDEEGGGNDFDVAEGDRLRRRTSARAGTNPVKVINMSLGGHGSSETLRRAVDRAVAGRHPGGGLRGQRGRGRRSSFPAAFDERDRGGRPSTGASSARPTRTSGPPSTWSPPAATSTATTTTTTSADVRIPADARPRRGLHAGRYDDFCYCGLEGTSMASPHVAALAALLFSQGISDPARRAGGHRADRGGPGGHRPRRPVRPRPHPAGARRSPGSASTK